MRLPRGWAQLLSGMAPFAVLGAGLTAIVMTGGTSRQGTLIGLSVIAVLLGWSTLAVVRSGVYLEDDNLLVVRPVGSKRWARADIRKASEGSVVWVRSIVPGVEIELQSGREVPLAFSYLLTARRRTHWVRQLNEWILH